MAIYRVKNTTTSSLTVMGVIISAQSYYDIEPEELYDWRRNSEVFQYIADGTLIVNKGSDNIDDITEPLKGWEYLTGELKPPEDSKGRWEIVVGDPKEDSSYFQFLWSVEILIDVGHSYESYIDIPASGISLNIEQFIISSPDINYTGKMKFVRVSGQETAMINPMIDVESFYDMKVDSIVSAGTNVIPVSTKANFNIANVIISSIYVFEGQIIEQQTGNKRFYEKIIDTCAQQMFIKTEHPLTVNLDDNVKIAMAERPILSLGGNKQTVIAKTQYPFKIRRETLGTENYYLAIELKNEHPTNAGTIYATLYGYKKIE